VSRINAMNPTDSLRPWLDLYDVGVPLTMAPKDSTIVSGFREAMHSDPQHVVIRYFDCSMTMRELDQASDGLAAALQDKGFAHGDRLAMYLQNVPQFVMASLAVWKLGGIVVTVNPMYQTRELHEVLSDSGAKVLVCHAGERLGMALETAHRAGVERVLACDARAYQTRDDARAFGTSDSATLAMVDGAAFVPECFEALVTASLARTPANHKEPLSSDVATLIYTSGTTGPAKGVVSTHAHVAQSVELYRQWMPLGRNDVILAIAPLVHVTGMLAYLATALWIPATLVLTHRFEVSLFCDMVRETGATFTIGPTTVFVALLESPDVSPDDLKSLTKVYSGGAPVPASIVDRFQAKFGFQVLGIYGMTETTGPTHMALREQSAPVDQVSGALAVGIPISQTDVLVLDDAHQPVACRVYGELAISGPQVATRYWNKPEESAASFTAQGFLTGDIGFVDEQGWFYIVDRKKDQINVSGFKVWPREVEDTLYGHPAVAECAVVGMPHSYRGEEVCAFIVRRAGQPVLEEEIREFCSHHLARFKVPGVVKFVSELPRTASGKILRRLLRDGTSA
jgi:long-chain acyl-CoA synthetase